MNLEKLISIIFFFVCVTLLYWYFYPYKPLEVKSFKLINENNIVKAGTDTIILFEFKKNTNLTPTVTRAVYNGYSHTTPVFKPIREKGEYITFISISIPSYFDSGIDYYVSEKACYQMNPIREVCVTYRTDNFTVIK